MGKERVRNKFTQVTRSVSEGESRSVEGASRHSPSLTHRVTFETESSFLKSGSCFGRVPKWHGLPGRDSSRFRMGRMPMPLFIVEAIVSAVTENASRSPSVQSHLNRDRNKRPLTLPIRRRSPHLQARMFTWSCRQARCARRQPPVTCRSGSTRTHGCQLACIASSSGHRSGHAA
jgi:hypothetical protein